MAPVDDVEADARFGTAILPRALAKSIATIIAENSLSLRVLPIISVLLLSLLVFSGALLPPTDDIAGESPVGGLLTHSLLRGQQIVTCA
jgi:hypothetical protein